MKENSHSKLPNVGGEEIQVTVPVIMANGDLYVRKLTESKQSNTATNGHLTMLSTNNTQEAMVRFSDV